MHSFTSAYASGLKSRLNLHGITRTPMRCALSVSGASRLLHLSSATAAGIATPAASVASSIKAVKHVTSLPSPSCLPLSCSIPQSFIRRYSSSNHPHHPPLRSSRSIQPACLNCTSSNPAILRRTRSSLPISSLSHSLFIRSFAVSTSSVLRSAFTSSSASHSHDSSTVTYPFSSAYLYDVGPLPNVEEKNIRLRCLEVSSDGHCRECEYSRAELSEQLELHPRDLRFLDTSLRNLPSILTRKRVIIVNLELFKALITRDRVLMFDPDYPHVAKVVQPLQASLLQSDHPGSEGCTPFEFIALEHILLTVCRSLEARYDVYMSSLAPLLASMGGGSGNGSGNGNGNDSSNGIHHLLASEGSGTTLMHLLQLKNGLTSFEVVLRETGGALRALLEADEDMADMYLTRKHEEEARLLKAKADAAWAAEEAARRATEEAARRAADAVAWERYRDLPIVIASGSESSHATSSPTHSSPSTSSSASSAASSSSSPSPSPSSSPSSSFTPDDLEHTEIEMILETYLRKVSELENEVDQNLKSITLTEEHIQIRLDSTRNSMMKLELLASISTFGVTSAAFGAALFGMNLPNHLEHAPWAFPAVTCVFAIMAGLIIRAGCQICKRRNINLFHIEPKEPTLNFPHVQHYAQNIQQQSEAAAIEAAQWRGSSGATAGDSGMHSPFTGYHGSSGAPYLYTPHSYSSSTVINSVKNGGGRGGRNGRTKTSSPSGSGPGSATGTGGHPHSPTGSSNFRPSFFSTRSSRHNILLPPPPSMSIHTDHDINIASTSTSLSSSTAPLDSLARARRSMDIWRKLREQHHPDPDPSNSNRSLRR